MDYSKKEIRKIQKDAGKIGYVVGGISAFLMMGLVMLFSGDDEGRVQVTSKSVGGYELMFDGDNCIRFRTDKLGIWSWSSSKNNINEALKNIKEGKAYFEVYLDYNPETKERYDQKVRYVEPVVKDTKID